MVYIPAPAAAPTRGQAAARTPARAVVPILGRVVVRIQVLAVAHTQAPAAGRTPAQVAVPIPDQEAALIPAPVVGATAGRAVVAQINGIGLILIAKLYGLRLRDPRRKALMSVALAARHPILPQDKR